MAEITSTDNTAKNLAITALLISLVSLVLGFIAYNRAGDAVDLSSEASTNSQSVPLDNSDGGTDPAPESIEPGSTGSGSGAGINDQDGM